MRVWGYIVFFLGIIFIILFLLANFGGAHIQVLPFLIALFLIFAGVKLIKYRKGILESTATESRTGATEEAATKKMPMSREVANAIKKQIARSWKIILYLVSGYVIVFILIGALIGTFDKKPQEAIALALVFGVLGIFTALMTVLAFWLTNGLPVRKDLREKNYLRTQGPIKVIPFLGGAILQLADRAFLINGRNGMKELSKINAGTVDYSPHGHIILAAWDSKGQIIYRTSGYNIELKELRR